MKKDTSHLIYGTRAVMEAIEAEKEIDRLYIQKNLQNELINELYDTARKFKIPFSKVPIEKLNRLTRKNHQGVVAFVSAISFANLDNIINECYQQGKDPLVVILDEITDVRNFGAIARTADAAGVDALVIPGKGSAAVNSDAVKTSAGALNHLPVCRVDNLEMTIKTLKSSGIRIVGLSEKAEDILHNTDLTGPVAIVLGSEESGIHHRHLKLCDELIKIPMYGKISSLNVSVSGGIGLFEIVRQRNL